MARLLIADDEKRVRDSIKLTLSGEDYDIIEAEELATTYDIIISGKADIVLLDVHFGDGQNCLSLLQRLKGEETGIPIVLLSGAASAKEAADAIRLGAYDFLEKPVAAERLRVTLANALSAAAMKVRAHSSTVEKNVRTELIGESPAMHKVRTLIGQFGRHDAKMLITGETGTGKELVAHALWRASSRSNRPFIMVNAAAIPENLMESELFGHRKGAFTGAVAHQMGKIELADRGTLFLDEIGELSPSAQSKLLRFLESGEIQPLGETRSRRCDVRIVAATSRDLAEQISRGRFREDLYFRLNVGRIEIAPLRERGEDIMLLFTDFVAAICRKYAEPTRLIDSDARSLLLNYNWPGNVRELRNVAERAILLSSEKITNQLISEILGCGAVIPAQADDLPASLQEASPLKEYRRSMEARYIKHILALTDNSVTRAALVLGVDRSHLHQKMKDYRIAL